MNSTDSSTVGWTQPRVRRARMFALLLLACVLLAGFAVTRPWFAWATPGLVPSCEPAPANAPTISVQLSDRSILEGVAARGCTTGLELTSTYSSAVGTAAGVASAQGELTSSHTQAAPSAMLGMPRAFTLLAACLGVAALGVFVRRGWLGVIATFFLQVPHRDLSTIRTLFLQDSAASLTTAMPALQWFSWALLLGTVVAVTSTIFVLKVNAEHRAHLRKTARDNGELVAEPLDPLTNYVGRKIAKVRRASADEMSTPLQPVS